MDAKEQFQILTGGISQLIQEEEFLTKLKRSVSKKIPLKIKYGADPSAPDIHLGHSIPLMKLRQFQDLGHEVIFIIGDFTARIGDPSGKTKTRPVLTEEQVQLNARTYQDQIFKILIPEKTEIVFNSLWFNEMQFASVIDIASKYNVARMLERDDFHKRFHSQESISILEFFYPLIQGYDSVYLRNDVELGGTDQTFNFLVGRDLMKAYEIEPQIVMTLPILEGTDGVKKMSKSYGNYIGIDEAAVDIYGKVMSVSDELMLRYNHLLYEEIKIKDDEKRNLDDREILADPLNSKKQLAYRLTRFFKGSDEADKAKEYFQRVHQSHQNPDDMEEFHLDKSDFHLSMIKLVQNSGLVSSQSEGRRLLQQGAVKIDGKKMSIDDEIELKNGMILQVGKRRFKKIKIN